MDPWLRFSLGLLAGCWIGVLSGAAIALLFAGRRIRQLETANMLLRVKLRSREKQRERAAAGGGGSLLIVPPRTNRSASAPIMARVASGGR